MVIVTSRTSLSQGQSKAVSDAVFATGTGSDIKITSVGSNLPALAVNAFFEIRGHSHATNNGLYQVVTVTTSTSDYECNKVSGSNPVVHTTEAITVLGATGASTSKSVFFDCANLDVYILEKGYVDSAGVTGQAIYSFMMQEWKDDDYLIANAPFPMLCIDADAGKYIIGQDASGNSSGWNWIDVSEFSIRTRKLLRNMGWDEVDSAGITKARYAGIVTLGSFEDPLNDNAYYMFGSDTTVDNTVDFDFAGPVNEAVRFFNEIGNPPTCTFATSATITRATGSFITDGYVKGGQVTVRAATTPGNNGTYVLTGVEALTLTVTGTPFTTGADTAAMLAVDNDNAITHRLRVRDADTYGKSFGQANLTSAGKTILGNFIYAFPMANAADQKITATDAEMSGSPYSGMTITFYASGQPRSGLVGGTFNFGIIVEGNNGTDTEVAEFIQYKLRQLTDIAAGGVVAIGRAVDGLIGWDGNILQAGSTDKGLTFPTNPEGGGSGVFIDNLNAASANTVKFWDNTGALRSKPETIAVTLDFNQVLIDDATAEYDLFYDRTIRTSITDFVLTSGTNKITSAGNQLPTNAQVAVNKYIRISGLTGANAAMNGIYQITAITDPDADWTVIRYDGAAIVSVTSTTVSLDQNCVDTPDAIIVHTNVSLVGTGIQFVGPDTLTDTGNGLAIFSAGDVIEITETTNNNGIYTVDTAVAGTITLIEQTIVNEAVGTATLTKVVSGLASVDETFSYDFDGNVQGGRTVSTSTYVRAKAIGSTTAQYVTSTVQTIATGTPLTIPLVAQTERNYA